MQDGPSYPKLFTHLEHPTAHLPAGARSIVKDLGTFQQHFKHITGGLFEGVDWSNMIVAGDYLMCFGSIIIVFTPVDSYVYQDS